MAPNESAVSSAAPAETRAAPASDGKAALKAMMSGLSLEPLWEIYANLVTPEPTGLPPAHQWRWQEMEPVVAKATEAVTGHDADHRVLVLRNPNLGGRMASTSTSSPNSSRPASLSTAPSSSSETHCTA